MATQKNSQKVIEAEANLQVAQMLEAIDRLVKNLKDFGNKSSKQSYYSKADLGENSLNNFIEVAKIMKSMV